MEHAYDYSLDEDNDESLFGEIDDYADFERSGGEGGSQLSIESMLKAQAPRTSSSASGSDVGSEVVVIDWVDTPAKDSESLTESVTDYPTEHGRRYHSFRAGQYLLPNDEAEQERLDLAHRLFKLILRGRLHLAPISKDPRRIIDLGTGTGVWAIECGELYPDAEVVGTDLSPIQPTFVPPNVRFEVDDITDDWLWDKDYFDYVHCRTLIGSISDWPKFLGSIYDHLVPGGYCEVQEVHVTQVRSDDGSYDPKGRYAKYMALLHEAGSKAGRPLDVAPQLKDMMEKAGFVDVVEMKHKCPFGDWAKSPRLKQMGLFSKGIFRSGIEAYALALFTRVLGMGEDEVLRFIQGVMEEVDQPGVHIYWTVHFVYGRKPTLDELIVRKLAEQRL